MESNIEEFRNNLFCRRESNQRKARKLWSSIEHLLPEKQRVEFIIDWSHYMLGEMDSDEFGRCYKLIEPLLKK